jgi:aminoglycoside phosphotransferase family enzyme/predicted kinase
MLQFNRKRRKAEQVGRRAPDSSQIIAQQSLIRGLENPAVYEHAVTELRVIETHASWVILTGSWVYKIKKAVDFGFLDYSTLEKRKSNCQEELRLNRRFAPHVYIDVIAIAGTFERPSLQAGGEPIEYAVRMKQFPQSGLLSTLAARHALTAEHIDALAVLVPAMHAAVSIADKHSGYGLPDDIHHWVMENFDHIRPALREPQQRQQLDTIEHWCREEFDNRQILLEQRRCDGFVRECHGDLHLGNLAIIEGDITPFDGIEFNLQLRWIDVISEVAFLVMDIHDRGYPRLSCRLLNAWLQHTGDYSGLTLLRYYLVYRALVRAKVAILRQTQAKSTLDEQDAWYEYASYMELASRYVKPPLPVLIITHGVSGSGKSFYATRLAEQLGAIQVRSDLERKRLYGYPAGADTQSGIKAGLYSSAASERTYEQLAVLAGKVIGAGYPVIIDATFLQFARREQFRLLAGSLAVSFVLLHFDADMDTLSARIRSRQAAGEDPSEAGIEVLEAQLDSQDRLAPAEMADVISVELSRGLSADKLTGQLAGKIHAMAASRHPGEGDVVDS